MSNRGDVYIIETVRSVINLMDYANEDLEEAISYAESGDMGSMLSCYMNSKSRQREISALGCGYNYELDNILAENKEYLRARAKNTSLELDLQDTLDSCKCDCRPIHAEKRDSVDTRKEFYRKFTNKQLEDQLDYLHVLSGEWEGRIDPSVYAITEIVNERADAVEELYDMRKYKKPGTSPHESYSLPLRVLKKPVLKHCKRNPKRDMRNTTGCLGE
jgi:hypothetical protein